MRAKKALLAIGGTVAGIVTLQSVRKRRSKDTVSEPEAVTHENPETATEHAEAAAEHASLAARKMNQR